MENAARPLCGPDSVVHPIGWCIMLQQHSGGKSLMVYDLAFISARYNDFV